MFLIIRKAILHATNYKKKSYATKTNRRVTVTVFYVQRNANVKKHDDVLVLHIYVNWN